MIDTHCHLQDDPLGADPSARLAEARAVGVTGWLVPGADLASSQAAVALAAAHPGVGAAVGVHPWFAGEGPVDLEALARLASAPGVAAIGEIGLDADSGPPLPAQEAAFRAQLGLARDLGLPVSIHSRGAVALLVEVLESFGPGPGGALHAFGGSPEVAARLRRLGYLRGVAGTVTRVETRHLQRVVAASRLEDLLLETDAPYLPTVRHARGEVVPADLADVARAVAELQERDVAEVVRVTTAGALRVFPGLARARIPGGDTGKGVQ